jgi:thiol-disulfide isomerase/thioredoxin
MVARFSGGGPLRQVLFLLLAMALVLPGCDRPPRSAPVQPPGKAVSVAPSSVAPAIALDVKGWDETQTLVAAQRGRVVVLDLWSTWCAPCMREFPNLVRLQRMQPQDVVCISFNMDYSGAAGETPESARVKVQEFLSKHEATIVNVLSRDAADDVFRRLKLASIPAVQVYDRSGKLVQQFDLDDGRYGPDGFTYAQHIVPLVERLLAQK